MARAQVPGPPPGRPQVVDPWPAAAAQRMHQYDRWTTQRNRVAQAPGIADGPLDDPQHRVTQAPGIEDGSVDVAENRVSQVPGIPDGPVDVAHDRMEWSQGADDWAVQGQGIADEGGLFAYGEDNRGTWAPGIADAAEGHAHDRIEPWLGADVPAVPEQSIPDDDEVITFSAGIEVADQVGVVGEAVMQEPRLSSTDRTPEVVVPEDEASTRIVYDRSYVRQSAVCSTVPTQDSVPHRGRQASKSRNKIRQTAVFRASRSSGPE